MTTLDGAGSSIGANCIISSPDVTAYGYGAQTAPTTFVNLANTTYTVLAYSSGYTNNIGTKAVLTQNETLSIVLAQTSGSGGGGGGGGGDNNSVPPSVPANNSNATPLEPLPSANLVPPSGTADTSWFVSGIVGVVVVALVIMNDKAGKPQSWSD